VADSGGGGGNSSSGVYGRRPWHRSRRVRRGEVERVPCGSNVELMMDGRQTRVKGARPYDVNERL